MAQDYARGESLKGWKSDAESWPRERIIAASTGHTVTEDTHYLNLHGLTNAALREHAANRARLPSSRAVAIRILKSRESHTNQ
ncbi:MAG: hypothetical protein AAB573_00640 [Patescibacteria group bacterium]